MNVTLLYNVAATPILHGYFRFNAGQDPCTQVFLQYASPSHIQGTNDFQGNNSSPPTPDLTFTQLDFMAAMQPNIIPILHDSGFMEKKHLETPSNTPEQNIEIFLNSLTTPTTATQTRGHHFRHTTPIVGGTVIPQTELIAKVPSLNNTPSVSEVQNLRSQPPAGRRSFPPIALDPYQAFTSDMFPGIDTSFGGAGGGGDIPPPDGGGGTGPGDGEIADGSNGSGDGSGEAPADGTPTDFGTLASDIVAGISGIFNNALGSVFGDSISDPGVDPIQTTVFDLDSVPPVNLTISSASCTEPRTFTTFLGTHSFDMAMPCSYLTMLSPVIILISTIFAAFIIVGAGRT
jgi:hypothetical protein